jgi:hypothetical protein
MLTKTFVLLASAALALAAPAGPAPPKPAAPAGPAAGPAGCIGKTQPALPVNGGARELAQPPAGTKLKAIALGFGIQNYTCASDTASAVATGAVAMLYDITKLYPGQGPKSLSVEAFNALTTTALWNHDVPLNFDPVTDDRIAGSKPASLTAPFTASEALKLDGLDPIPFAGHHFFRADGKPAFVLNKDVGNTGKDGINYVAKKEDAIDAPTTSDKGPEGTGVVGWLQLSAVEDTKGASMLYRVVTAGGNSHGCANGGKADSVSYAAQYWFFG